MYKNKNAPCNIMYGISTNLLNDLYFNAIIIEVTVKIMNNTFQIDNDIQGVKDWKFLTLVSCESYKL